MAPASTTPLVPKDDAPDQVTVTRRRVGGAAAILMSAALLGAMLTNRTPTAQQLDSEADGGRRRRRRAPSPAPTSAVQLMIKFRMFYNTTECEGNDVSMPCGVPNDGKEVFDNQASEVHTISKPAGLCFKDETVAGDAFHMLVCEDNNMHIIQYYEEGCKFEVDRMTFPAGETTCDDHSGDSPEPTTAQVSSSSRLVHESKILS